MKTQNVKEKASLILFSLFDLKKSFLEELHTTKQSSKIYLSFEN